MLAKINKIYVVFLIIAVGQIQIIYGAYGGPAVYLSAAPYQEGFGRYQGNSIPFLPGTGEGTLYTSVDAVPVGMPFIWLDNSTRALPPSSQDFVYVLYNGLFQDGRHYGILYKLSLPFGRSSELIGYFFLNHLNIWQAYSPVSAAAPFSHYQAVATPQVPSTAQPVVSSGGFSDERARLAAQLVAMQQEVAGKEARKAERKAEKEAELEKVRLGIEILKVTARTKKSADEKARIEAEIRALKEQIGEQ